MKEAVTKVIDTLTQEAFQKLLEQYNKCIAAGGEFHVCTINKSAHREKVGNLFNDPRTCFQKKMRMWQARNLNFKFS